MINSDRKISYLKKRVDELEDYVRELEQTNEMISKEALRMEETYEERLKELQARQARVEEMENYYKDLIKELVELKRQYEQVLGDACAFKEEYLDMVKTELTRLQQFTRNEL